MQILQNASKLTIRQRQVVAILVTAFILTNSHVSTAQAAGTIPDVPEAIPTVQAVAASVLAGTLPSAPEKPKTLRVLETTATAYSSSPRETDGSPFVTATGACVQDGIVAANFLPFGTKFRMPELFGDKVFEVQDRMNSRYTIRVDVWMKSPEDARQFGLKRNVKIEIIENGDGVKSWDLGNTNDECRQLANA